MYTGGCKPPRLYESLTVVFISGRPGMFGLEGEAGPIQEGLAGLVVGFMMDTRGRTVGFAVFLAVSGSG